MKGSMIKTLKRHIALTIVVLAGISASSALAAGTDAVKITWSLTNTSIKERRATLLTTN